VTIFSTFCFCFVWVFFFFPPIFFNFFQISGIFLQFFFGFFPNFGQISTSYALPMRLMVHFALQFARIPEP